MRILIVEDDKTSRYLLASVLTKTGYEVLETANGQSAWEIMQQPNPPQLLIVDWLMPEMDGLDLIQHVRQAPDGHIPYIILLTVRSEQQDIIQGLDAGANDYLVKPSSLGELRARVEVGRRHLATQQALLEAQNRLHHQQRHDLTTDTLSRQYFLGQCSAALAQPRPHNAAVAIGTISLKNLKEINATWGDPTGDDALHSVAATLTRLLPANTAVGRLGSSTIAFFLSHYIITEHTSMMEQLAKQLHGASLSTRSGEIPPQLAMGICVASGQPSLQTVLRTVTRTTDEAKGLGELPCLFAYVDGAPASRCGV